MDFDAVFKPRSIAIYGASNNPIKVGGRPLRYLLEQNYDGEIYPINPKYESVQGVHCYASTEEIPYGVDLVIIAVPAAQTYGAIEHCVMRGIKSAVILTAGFGEVGAEGLKLQNSITELARSHGMHILGPNCLGMMNIRKKIPATFASILERKDMKPGSIAMISQSGAFGNHILGMAQDMQVGISYWITTGNEADIQLNDCIEFAAEDEDTDVIAGYVEDVRDGAKFMRVLDKCLEKEKPVVLCKVGKTASGSMAAQSHTGALAGNYQVYEAVFKQKGVIQANSLYEMLDYSAALARKTSVNGNRVAVVTISGGAGVMIADKCEECGMRLAHFNTATEAALKAVLPVFASVKNPVDITAQAVADPALFGDAVNICLKDPETDAVVIYLGALDSIGPKIAEKIIEVADNTEKPLAVTWVSGPKNAIEMLKQHQIMVFDEPMRCVNTLGKMIGYRLFVKDYKAHKSSASAELQKEEHSELKAWLKEIAEKRKVLSEYEARKVLAAFDIPVVDGDIAYSSEEAVRVAEKIGYPVVLKVNSPDVPHKSDVGGVMLNLHSGEEVRRAYVKITENVHKALGENIRIDGLLVEKMERCEVETLIGLKYDAMFGPTVVFGLGGIFVEVFKDVSLRTAPLDYTVAAGMLEEIKAVKILNGSRGRKPTDKEAIIRILMNVSRLSIELSDVVKELDINPLFVYADGEGAKAGDALLVLK